MNNIDIVNDFLKNILNNVIARPDEIRALLSYHFR
jgi:hypothetical protein